MNGGRNQHYIARLLEHAFGIPTRRREIWRFSLDEPPERRLTKRTGSEDNFYSRPSADGQPTLDGTITTIEPHLSQMLRDVRSAMLREPIDAGKAAAIVSHTLNRTAHFRSAFQIGYTHLRERLQALLGQPANGVVKLTGPEAVLIRQSMCVLLFSYRTSPNPIRAPLPVPKRDLGAID